MTSTGLIRPLITTVWPVAAASQVSNQIERREVAQCRSSSTRISGTSIVIADRVGHLAKHAFARAAPTSGCRTARSGRRNQRWQLDSHAGSKRKGAVTHSPGHAWGPGARSIHDGEKRPACSALFEALPSRHGKGRSPDHLRDTADHKRSTRCRPRR